MKHGGDGGAAFYADQLCLLTFIAIERARHQRPGRQFAVPSSKSSSKSNAIMKVSRREGANLIQFFNKYIKRESAKTATLCNILMAPFVSLQCELSLLWNERERV